MWGFTCAAATRGQSYKPTCGNLSWVHHCSLTALVRLTQRRGNITRAGAYAAFLLFCSSATRQETPTSPDEGEIRRDLLPEDGSCPPTARAEGEPVPVSGYRAKQMWPDVATQQTPAALEVHLWLRLDAEQSAGRRCSGRWTLNIRAESGLRSTLRVCRGRMLPFVLSLLHTRFQLFSC